ncbi:hypothetical protein HYG77_04825 [Rhodococcus sp. ZPP]|uniref:hypothetical protein n=1 Tax=Rhodococcus sp. ZPP TaxID=2749906 RepID=UPI001AD86171|nr:hypothetical protein [Rhodococcus sp. ZPP]QTJ64987.1 hypothetical protein HYG77_04825 [Rhodococcus sp. ZPP]
MDLYRHVVKSIAKLTAGVMHELANGIDSEQQPQHTTIHIAAVHIHCDHSQRDDVTPRFPIWYRGKRG